MSKKKQRKDHKFDANVCAFCGQPSDEKKYGKFFTSNLGFAVHQYCMFFSANLPQRGKDEEGFEGFLEEDVLKEIRRASRLRCYLCSKKGASAGCCDSNCRKGFHFSCGVNNKYLFQFYNEFRAYCVDHRLQQNTKSRPSKRVRCPICLEKVHCFASHDVLTTPCCKDTWFHRSCVQEQASVSGYFFRCAVCNDTEKFVKEMKRMGVYVPDRDAAWEEGNNFADLLEKYSRCDHDRCTCPMGRNFSTDSGQWELILCTSCGQYGTHVGCKTWTNRPSLICPTCRPVFEDNKPIMRASEPLTTNLGGTAIASHKTRKGKCRRKRRYADSDMNSDGISTVLNKLSRQTQADFLNSDTNFFVQRALAAGTAAMKHGSGAKKFRISEDNQSASTTQNEKADDKAWKPSTESDDEIVITKYIPGQKCEMCSKCNKRKPIKNPFSPSAQTPRRSFPSTGSTCTVTKADVERKVGITSGGTAKLGKYDAEVKEVESRKKVTVADYEVLELAAEYTDKSSVLILSSDVKPSLHQNDTNCPQKPPTTSSFWLSSVGRIIELLTPSSSTDLDKVNDNNTDGQEIPNTTATGQSTEFDRACRKLDSSFQSTDTNTEVSNVSGRSSDANLTVQDSKEKPEATGESYPTLRLNSGTSAASPEVNSDVAGKCTELLGKEPESTVERSGSFEKISNNKETSLKPAQQTGSNTSTASSSLLTNTRKRRVRNDFSQFCTKKAVLEAAIERAMELKRAGKHQCVSSC